VLREPVVSVSLAGWKSNWDETSEERRRLEEEVRELRSTVERLRRAREKPDRTPDPVLPW